MEGQKGIIILNEFSNSNLKDIMRVLKILRILKKPLIIGIENKREPLMEAIGEAFLDCIVKREQKVHWSLRIRYRCSFAAREIQKISK